jgi:hypothetical protein
MYSEPLLGDRKKRAGADLCGGYRGAYVGSKHDSKARREVHLFKRNYSATFCCDDCLATQAFKNAPRHLLFSNCSDTAPHLDTFISHSWYMAEEAELSPFNIIPGGHKSIVFRDIMHDLWLGCGRDDVASIIVDLLENHELVGASPQDRLNRLWKKCRTFCDRNHMSYPRGGFSIAQLGRENKSQHPDLSSKYKAMHVKKICKFLADVTYEHDTGDDKHRAMRSVLMWGLVHMVHVWDNAFQEGRFRLTHSEVADSQYAGRKYLLAYQWLALESARLGTHNFKMRPKRHYVDHTLRGLVNRLNPAAISCDDDETYMGIIKRIGSKAHGSTAMLRMLQRYLAGLAMRVLVRKRYGSFQVHRA